jgi:hypothetical protein
LTLEFQRPIGFFVGSISYTTTANESKLGVIGGLVQAMQNNAALQAAGYRMFNQSGAFGAYGVVLGPPGVTGIYVLGSGGNGFVPSVSLKNQGSPAYAADQAQIIEITIAGTPAIGEEFWSTLDSVEYAFTAASTSASDVATGLGADIDALLYSVGVTGSVITVESLTPLVPFTYDRGVRTLMQALVS